MDYLHDNHHMVKLGVWRTMCLSLSGLILYVYVSAPRGLSDLD